MSTRNPILAGLYGRAAEFLPEIAEGAAEHERLRELPRSQIREIGEPAARGRP
ncbi:hypothetical protein AB0M44_27995 [Streptosporangium subroseum]|uniref:hypothetical protein n=1 Tax=Streptosporangium subroseum TaxID=106412 RepID=UPI003423AD9A